MFPNHNPEINFNFSDGSQVQEEPMEPSDNQRNMLQQPNPNNRPIMSLSSGYTSVNFWNNGPVSVHIYPGENSHFHFHQATAPNFNYLQPGPGPRVQSPLHLSSIPNSNGHQLGAPNPGNGFPSPSFSDAMTSVSSLQVSSTPSTTGASSGQNFIPISPTDIDVHRFTPHYSAEYLHEYFDWDLHRARLEAEQNEQSSESANLNGTADAGASATQRQRSRHTVAAPVSRPATRAYTRQQNQSL